MSEEERIPTEQRALELLEQKIPKDSGVWKHSLKVTKIAVLIAEGLYKAGVNVNKEKVRTGALLHDWEKYNELRERKKGNKTFFHNIQGAKTIVEEGYPALMGIILNHMITSYFEMFNSIEEKIVCYADKRAKGDKIVPLTERYEDAMKRYPYVKVELVEDRKAALRLEKCLFEKLNFKPEDLEKLIEND